MADVALDGKPRGDAFFEGGDAQAEFDFHKRSFGSLCYISYMMVRKYGVGGLYITFCENLHNEKIHFG